MFYIILYFIVSLIFIPLIFYIRKATDSDIRPRDYWFSFLGGIFWIGLLIGLICLYFMFIILGILDLEEIRKIEKEKKNDIK